MTKYQPGEIVDISIRGAKVVKDDGFVLDVAYHVGSEEDFTGTVSLAADGHGVTVDRVASAEWPPQPGDLWRSEETDRLWFIRKHQPCGDVDCPDEVEMVDTSGERYTFGSTVPVALRPLTLVYRESSAVKP